MQIVFHIGAHATDEDRLLRCLLKNKEMLGREGVSVPGPGRYRKLLFDTLKAARSGPVSQEGREVLLDAILEEDHPTRLILSNENFICVPHRIFDRDQLYDMAARRLRAMADLFPGDEIEFHIGLRNPATFVPAVFGKLQGTAFGDFIGATDLGAVRWSDLIARIQAALPGAAITAWCNEDLPLIWGEVIRNLADIDPLAPITGEFAILDDIMSDEGMAHLRAYIDSHPPQTEAQRRRVIAAFLEKFALEDEFEQEIDLPGWSEDVVTALSDAYEEEFYTLQHMPGVTFITP